MCASHSDPEPGWRSSYPRREGDGCSSSISRAFGGVFQAAEREGGEAVRYQNTSESHQTVTLQIMLHHAFIIYSAITLSLHAFMDVLHHSSLACITWPQDGLLPHDTNRSLWTITRILSLIYVLHVCMHACLSAFVCVGSWFPVLVSSSQSWDAILICSLGIII